MLSIVDKLPQYCYSNNQSYFSIDEVGYMNQTTPSCPIMNHVIMSNDVLFKSKSLLMVWLTNFLGLSPTLIIELSFI
jgi:hypothetical protein